MLSAPQVLTVADPAAGVNWSYTQPAGSAKQVVGITWFANLSNAQAGNRRLGWVMDDGTGTLQDVILTCGVANSNLAATDDAFFSAFPGSEAVSFTSGMMNLGLPTPNGLFLLPTYRLSSFCNGIQSGDQFSKIRVLYHDLDQW